MSDDPTEGELPGELRRALSTLSDEAQQIASRAFIQGGHDPNRDGISLDEMLVNLTHARDVLSDALETGKFAQSPVTLQYDLYGQVRALDRGLARLAEGQDGLPDLQAGVEKLNAEVWQYRLLDLSPAGVRGFHARTNRLRSQEAVVHKAARNAAQFDSLLRKADQMVASIAEKAASISEDRTSDTKLVEQLQTMLRESAGVGQQMTDLGRQAARHESIATKQLVAARQAFSDTEAVAAKSREVQAEIEAGRATFEKLTAQMQQLLGATESAAKAQREVDAKQLSELASGISAQLAKATAAHQAALAKQLQESATKSDAAVAAFVTKSEASLTAGEDEVKRLVEHLDGLEDHIDEAMERATGASLIHASQRRQLEILGAKQFWGRASAVCVILLLTAVGYFVYSLQFVTAYDAAFYARLAISIPLTWAAGFCGFRYSRERKRAREFSASVPGGFQDSKLG